MPTPTKAAAKFDELARRLARGESVGAAEVHAVVIAAGYSFLDLERECDRLIAAGYGRPRKIAASAARK